MAFYEEKMSWIERKIGRRFPLAVILIVAACTMAYLGQSEVATALVTVVATVITGYFRDIDQEKQTIKLVEDETARAYSQVSKTDNVITSKGPGEETEEV